jgi:hypothetical protein
MTPKCPRSFPPVFIKVDADLTDGEGTEGPCQRDLFSVGIERQRVCYKAISPGHSVSCMCGRVGGLNAGRPA